MSAVAALPRRSLRRQFLVPFAVGVALLSLAVGVVTAWGARDAAQSELENRARTAARTFDQAMVAQQARLAREASDLAGRPEMIRALPRASGADLARLGVASALSNRFDYVAVSGLRATHVFSGRLADWRLLRRPALLDRVQLGIPVGGVTVIGDGTAALFAAVPARIAAARNGAVVVAEPIKAVNLEEIARPLDLSLELRTEGERVSSLAGMRDERPSVRTFTYPTRMARFTGGRAELTVGLSTAPLARATASAAVVAAVVALGLSLSLLLFVVFLLDRAVVRPLDALRTAIVQVTQGAYAVRLPRADSRELADVAHGFQQMAAMVGEQQARLYARATSDPLTGLANRAAFQAALEAAAAVAEREEVEFGVLAVDVDLFKEINDEHGHPFGDHVLRIIADELQAGLREGDVAARLGGDEFAVLLHDADCARASEVAERVRERLADVPVGQERLSLSIGVACYPAHGRQTDSLMEFADQALYAAKRAGRGQTWRYDEVVAAQRKEAPRPRGEREELLALLARPDAVVPAFQPIVSLTTGAVVAFEALARFPAGFERRPDAWFAQAHRCHLGPELEARAIEAARACPGRPARASLGLNVSPDALASPQVQAALAGPLDDIVIEITEQHAVKDAAALKEHLDALRARGARIALDDAGAGYAGLGQLLNIAPDVIKLDRCLIDDVIDDPARRALVEAFVRFARQTGVEVCGEGIETLEQALVLADLGVNYGQGFGLARPQAPWAAIEVDLPARLALRRLEREAAETHGDELVLTAGRR